MAANLKISRTNNRKKITNKGTFTYNGKIYRINNGKAWKDLECYTNILEKIIEQFELHLALWKRLLMVRFDLHHSYEIKDNKDMTLFLKRLFQKLKIKYKMKNIGYCWSREFHGKSKTCHYHCVIFLDGNKVRRSYRVKEIIKEMWIYGYVPFIKKDGYFVNSEEVVQDAIYRASYLAKVRGKGHRPDQVKDYSCSRMKK